MTQNSQDAIVVDEIAVQRKEDFNEDVLTSEEMEKQNAIFFDMVQSICRYNNNILFFIHTDNNKEEVRYYKALIFTDNNAYSIVCGLPTIEESGYLGCINTTLSALELLIVFHFLTL